MESLPRLKIKPVSNKTRQTMQLHASSKNIWGNRYMKEGLGFFYFRQTKKPFSKPFPLSQWKLMTVGRKACGGTHFLAIQALFSKSSSPELCFVPIAVLTPWQRLLVAKPLILSAGSKASYRQFSWRDDTQVMLLCPAAWGWGKSSVPCRTQLEVAAVNSKERRSSRSLLRSIHFSLQSGHTRAGLTHLCLLDFFIPRRMHNISLVLACGDQVASVLGLACGNSDTIFLSGTSQCSLSALVFILELLGFWAIAFLQHGEPQRVQHSLALF